jgi:hypothetical protein
MDDDDECGAVGRMICKGNRKYSDRTYSSANLYTPNSTWSEPGSNLGRSCGKAATNRLSYDTVSFQIKFKIHLCPNSLSTKWNARNPLPDLTVLRNEHSHFNYSALRISKGRYHLTPLLRMEALYIPKKTVASGSEWQCSVLWPAATVFFGMYRSSILRRGCRPQHAALSLRAWNTKYMQFDFLSTPAVTTESGTQVSVALQSVWM